jgi:RimJ/RimL family protein N-acetyltransferase
VTHANRPDVKIPHQIESTRLVIRPPRVGDAPAMVEAIAESIDELRPWMDWAQKVPSVEESEARFREVSAKIEAREDFQLLLFERQTGRLVGSSGLHRPDWSVPTLEIGYWVRTSLTGRGFATEAARAIAAFGFETFRARRIEIRTDSRNRASQRVAERAGFELEGILRNHMRNVDGGLRDTMLYSRIVR